MPCSEREKILSSLRESVRGEVKEKRYAHILRVEECAERMARLYSDVLGEEDIFLIRAAALLHDVTKDKGDEWQRRFIAENGTDIPQGDEDSKPLWHSFTAPGYISLHYPEFSHPTVLNAVRRHATGDAQMTLADKIICLADYIEDGRKYPSCIDTREKFFGFEFSSASATDRVRHLNTCLLLSLEYVKEHLEANGEKLSSKTKEATDALRKEINLTEVT